jgi:hypothetical protein
MFKVGKVGQAIRLPILLAFAIPATAQTDKQAAPEQPLPFSHKAHAGTLKLKCKMCHPNPDPGEAMRIAAASVCMQCHSAIKTDSPAIQKLAAFAKNDHALPWVRVYEIPSYVNFSHRAHLESGNACEDCHGPVAERDKLSREADISMGGCMKCHQARKVSVDCTFCHEQR